MRAVVPILEGPFDAIFHDPFSPARMPELWTVDLFREYARLLRPRSGLLLTYSAAGAVRGGLQEAGFTVNRTEPVGEKQGGTIASFNDASGLPLRDDELAYLASRAGIPYRDPGLCQPRVAILAHRRQEQVQSTRPSGSAMRNNRRFGI